MKPLAVIALGGNALLKRNQPMTFQSQHSNAARAAAALLPALESRRVVLTHGNGPQVGLLANLSDSSAKRNQDSSWPLDILDAETEGMIGIELESAIRNVSPGGTQIATLLSAVQVDPSDPGFKNPTKFVGPSYPDSEARELESSRGWRFKRDGQNLRRVVPSPLPISIPSLPTIKTLLATDTLVICMGGGGIPFFHTSSGRIKGVEAVVDKDLASSLLAKQLGADELVILTDTPAVYLDFPASTRAIRRAHPGAIHPAEFPEGSMRPKLQAAVDFVTSTEKGKAYIGHLEELESILRGERGTVITSEVEGVEEW